MSLVILSAVLGCAHARLDALEARVAALEAERAAPASAVADESAEAAKKAREIYDTGDLGGAAAALSELDRTYPDLRSDAGLKRMRAELGVIGREAPALSAKWLAQPAAWVDAPVTLVVFFEAWCPHCKREMPKLAERQPALAQRGVQVVGLTRLTKMSTMDDLNLFLSEGQVRFPVGVEDGTISRALAVTGIPAAALVRDGKVIWRGHPAWLNEDRLAQVVAAPR